MCSAQISTPTKPGDVDTREVKKMTSKELSFDEAVAEPGREVDWEITQAGK